MTITTTDSREAAATARSARRDDLVDVIEQASTISISAVSCETGDLNVALRPDTHEVTIERWELPHRTLWLYISTIVGWGGGDASVWQDTVLTEYDLSDSDVLRVVQRLLFSEAISPARYQSDWAATNTQTRLVNGDLDALRQELDDGLRRWMDCVSDLRRLDSRPFPVPVVGGCEL